jgi:membrane protein
VSRDRSVGRTAALRERINRLQTTALEKFGRLRATRAWVDLSMRLYERDTEADGSVIAAAVALRVFLFFVPLVLFLVGIAGFASSHLGANDASRQIGVSGGFATQINGALHQSSKARWIAVVTGLFGAMWAGRHLAKVLLVANRRAWRLTLDEARLTSKTRVTGALTGMIAGFGILAIIVNRVRAAAGLVGGGATLFTAALIYSGGWLVVSLLLPRGRADRSALLPGALFVGVGVAVAQGAIQFLIPGRVSHASQLYGAIGIVIVALSWFFLLGRLFVFSFALDAVVWERFGSVTTFLLRSKRLRKELERHPRLMRFLVEGSGDATKPDAQDPQRELRA